MTEFPTYYGILDNDELRVGFVYTSLPKLIDSVSEAIIEVTNDEEILALLNEPPTLERDLDIIEMHGFEICELPAYIAEDIQFEESALVSMEDKYFYNGSLKFINKIENLKERWQKSMPTNIFEILAFSIMIGLFIIGYMRDGYLEGLRLSSYSLFLTTIIGFLVYYMINAKSIEKLVYDPVTKEIAFNKLPTEIYGFGFLFLLSFLAGITVEMYVNSRQKKEKRN